MSRPKQASRSRTRVSDAPVSRRMANRQVQLVRTSGDRRTDLLEISAILFAENGFAAVTVRDIGDAAGIQAASLYHYFEDKEAIFHALLRPYVSAMVEECETIAQRHTPPEETLVALVTAMLVRLCNQPNLHRILTHEERLFNEIAGFDYAQDYSQRISRIFHGVIQEGVRSGAFRDDVELALVSSLVVKLVDSTAEWFVPDTRHSMEAVTDSLLNLVLNGIATSPRQFDHAKLNQDVDASSAAFSRALAANFQESAGRRGEILKIAAGVFAQHRFDATSIRHIGEAAGILPSSVYHHFEDKAQLLHQLIKPFGALMVHTYQDAVKTQKGAEEALYALVGLGVDVITEHGDFSRILHREDQFFRRDREFAYAWTYGQDVVRIFYGILQEGVRSSVFRESIRLDIVVIMLAKLISTTGQSDYLIARYTRHDVTARMMAFLMQGLRGSLIETTKGEDTDE